MKRTSKTNWTRVDALQDKDIDYSDSPEVSDELFKLMSNWDNFFNSPHGLSADFSMERNQEAPQSREE